MTWSPSRSWGVLFAVIFTFSRISLGESVWQRAVRGTNSNKTLLLSSIEKALSGEADERELLRARVALTSLSRGRIVDPRVVLYLLRWRRELGYSPVQSSHMYLQEALGGALSHTEKAWAHLEIAHLSVHLQTNRQVENHLRLALKHAWREDVRAQVLVVRGWQRLQRNRPILAENDFLRVRGLECPQRLRVQATVGLAFVKTFHGDEISFHRSAFEASADNTRRSTVSGINMFWDLHLTPSSQKAARAVLLWGETWLAVSPKVRPGDLSKKLAVCALLRPPLQLVSSAEKYAPKQPVANPPQVTLGERLSEFLQEPCRRAQQLSIESEGEGAFNDTGEPTEANKVE